VRCRYYSRCMLADMSSDACMKGYNEYCGQFSKLKKESEEQ